MAYRDAVLVLTDRLTDTGIEWAVTASDRALRGFDVTPGGVEHRVDGRWGPAAAVATLREFPPTDGRPVPVAPLDHGRRGCRAIGRADRVDLVAGGPP